MAVIMMMMMVMHDEFSNLTAAVHLGYIHPLLFIRSFIHSALHKSFISFYDIATGSSYLEQSQP